MRRSRIRRCRVQVRGVIEIQRKVTFRTNNFIPPKELETDSELETEPERDTVTETETDPRPLTDEERRKSRLGSGQT
jgi:hypothetical protein